MDTTFKEENPSVEQKRPKPKNVPTLSIIIIAIILFTLSYFLLKNISEAPKIQIIIGLVALGLGFILFLGIILSFFLFLVLQKKLKSETPTENISLKLLGASVEIKGSNAGVIVLILFSLLLVLSVMTIKEIFFDDIKAVESQQNFQTNIQAVFKSILYPYESPSKTVFKVYSRKEPSNEDPKITWSHVKSIKCNYERDTISTALNQTITISFNDIDDTLYVVISKNRARTMLWGNNIDNWQPIETTLNQECTLSSKQNRNLQLTIQNQFK